MGSWFGPKIRGADPLGPSRGSATGLFIPYQSLLAQCKGIQDSLGFWIPRCGFRIPGTGFQSFSWIPIVGGIPDSLSCTPNPHAKISQITESGFPYTGRYGHQIALCRSNCEIHLRRV